MGIKGKRCSLEFKGDQNQSSSTVRNHQDLSELYKILTLYHDS